jgi:uncharacterized membrane protein HdeD (DUF308 family)
METLFVRSWRTLVVRGALGLLFGAAMLLSAQQPLGTLTVLFGVYALFDGIAAGVMAARSGAWEHAWLLGLEGLAGVGLGLAAFEWTRVAAELVILGVAVWAIATGLLEIAMAYRLRRQPPGELPTGAAGLASMLLGFAILYSPSTNATALAALLGSYGLVFGVSMLSQAVRVRGKPSRPRKHAAPPFGPNPHGA